MPHQRPQFGPKLADEENSIDDRLCDSASMGVGRPFRKSQAEDENKGGHDTIAGGGVRIRDGSRPCEVSVQQGATCCWIGAFCAATADLGVERMIADVHHAMGHPGIR
ncbi:hypothetical protein T02_5839 [Trichinella nativa]|uniref:Uncharacterized protein n=1 Tax=Trichinella nativa TaxID=6335 RepID=A0A0V1L440_9BILA|nr:hypothetical protein T02_5839 [Trichinella nativa]